jgi:hypothetical protein
VIAAKPGSNEIWRGFSSALSALASLVFSAFSSVPLSFEEAATVFGDSLGGIVADRRHSSGEQRFVLLGLSQDQRLLAVIYTDRDGAIQHH